MVVQSTLINGHLIRWPFEFRGRTTRGINKVILLGNLAPPPKYASTRAVPRANEKQVLGQHDRALCTLSATPSKGRVAKRQSRSHHVKEPVDNIEVLLARKKKA